jgi:hypothetical protein
MDEVQAYVGLDVHKDRSPLRLQTHAGGRVRFWGNIPIARNI